MMGLGLLYVGCVLLLNGVGMLKKFDQKAMAVMNFFTGGLYVVMNAISIGYDVFSGAGASAYYAVATSMLFGFTYLFVGITDWHGLDGGPLAWYCFFVALTTIPCSILSFMGGDWRFGIIWLVWGALWLVYWLSGAYAEKTGITVRFVGIFTLVTAIATCWIPGYMILANWW